jgi:HEAT repeat-containing protein 6
LRASLADSLANLGVHIFESLDVKKQTQLKSVLTGCSYDDDPNVKSSAVRALAVYVLFPTLREDLCFIENITESVLRVMKEQNVVARTKASFGLSNVVDCLLLIKSNSNGISESLLKQIVETCLLAGKDNDRVKVNAVRTLGSSIILFSRNQLENQIWIDLFEKSIIMLNSQLINCSNVKVKWNICYAFSSMMKNTLIFEEDLVHKWRESVFKTLCNTIEASQNFKVRTKSCMALTTPVKRIDYNVHFTEIWACLLKALDQSNNLTDFNEYKHRDMLQDKICFSICHLMSLTIIEDIIHMKNALYPLIDVTKQNWNRVINRLPPEFQNSVLIACNVIKKIGTEAKNSEQRNSSNIIVACFEPVEQQF